MYYLFIIKDNFFKNNSKYLYNILYTLKNISKNNYNYGVSLYYNICNLFDIEVLSSYISYRTKLVKLNNRYYMDEYNYIEIRNTCCIIKGEKYLKEMLCIFYIYNKNIFICDFKKNDYFWLEDKFK